MVRVRMPLCNSHSNGQIAQCNLQSLFVSKASMSSSQKRGMMEEAAKCPKHEYCDLSDPILQWRLLGNITHAAIVTHAETDDLYHRAYRF